MDTHPLINPTAFVTATGVFFDLWVSMFMSDPRLPERTVRIVTMIFVALLVYGIVRMAIAWQESKQSGNDSAS